MGKLARKASKKYSWEKSSLVIEQAFLKVYKNKIKSQNQTIFDALDAPLIGIQYFLWYGDGYGSSHWNDNDKYGSVATSPYKGFYSSIKGENINYHFDLFEDMNVDFIILNLHFNEKGIDNTELAGIQNVFAVAEERNVKFKFVIQFCLYTNNTEIVNSSLDFFNTSFLNKEHYLKRNGKAVVFWFW